MHVSRCALRAMGKLDSWNDAAVVVLFSGAADRGGSTPVQCTVPYAMRLQLVCRGDPYDTAGGGARHHPITARGGRNATVAAPSHLRAPKGASAVEPKIFLSKSFFALAPRDTPISQSQRESPRLGPRFARPIGHATPRPRPAPASVSAVCQIATSSDITRPFFAVGGRTPSPRSSHNP